MYTETGPWIDGGMWTSKCIVYTKGRCKGRKCIDIDGDIYGDRIDVYRDGALDRWGGNVDE